MEKLRLRHFLPCLLAILPCSAFGEASATELMTRAETDFSRHDLPAAEAGFQAALRIDPKTHEANLRLGQIARSRGKVREAKAFLLEELRVAPDNAHALVELGNIEIASRDFAEAQKYFELAAKANPKDGETLYQLGVTNRLIGRLGDAAAALKKAIALAPLRAEAYWQLGLTYQKQNKPSLAIDSFQRFKSLTPGQREKDSADARIEEIQEKKRAPSSP